MQRRPVIVMGMVGVATVVGASSLRAGAAAPAPVVPVFAHPVTVDAQRLAGEPDAAVSQREGTIYASAPWGVTTNTSFFWRSSDGGESFRQIQGAPGVQNPYNWRAGGDTEIQVGPPASVGGHDRLYAVNQNNLDTLSCAYSDDQGHSFGFVGGTAPGGIPGQGYVCPATAGADRQWLSLTGADPTVSNATPGGHQLGHEVNYLWYDHYVVGGNELWRSDDGITYTGGAAMTTADSQGNPGNTVADPSTGVVYVTAPSSGAGGNGVLVGYSADGGKTLVPVPAVADQYAGGTGTDFSVLAIDSSGNLYLVYSVQNGTNAWQVYETHTTGFTQVAPDPLGHPAVTVPVAGATAAQWSTPLPITGPGSSNPGITYAVFPWVTAGDAGRIDIAYYGSHAPIGYDPNSQTAAWGTYMTQSLNALSTSPSFATASVAETSTHLSSICFNGVGCTGQGNRNLLDFFEVQHDSRGAAVVVYNDDANSLTALFTGGPYVMEGRQVGGQSLFSAVGDLGGTATPDTSSVSDRLGDGSVPTNDANVGALDLTGAGAALDASAQHLVVTLSVADLTFPTGALATDGAQGVSYVLTWKYVDSVSGLPDVYFAAAHETAAGQFVCVAGKPQSVPFTGTGGPKFAVYGVNPGASTVPCAVGPDGHSVVITAPVSSLDNLAPGSRLLQASGFSFADRGSAATPVLADQADTTPSFDDTLGLQAGAVAEAPWLPALPLLAVLIVASGVGGRRRRRRSLT